MLPLLKELAMVATYGCVIVVGVYELMETCKHCLDRIENVIRLIVGS